VDELHHGVDVNRGGAVGGARRLEDARALLQYVQQRFFDAVVRVAPLELREGVRVSRGNRVFVEADSAHGVAQALGPAEAISLGLQEQPSRVKHRRGQRVADFDFDWGVSIRLAERERVG
jgi:hypothetical protein